MRLDIVLSCDQTWMIENTLYAVDGVYYRLFIPQLLGSTHDPNIRFNVGRKDHKNNYYMRQCYIQNHTYLCLHGVSAHSHAHTHAIGCTYILCLELEDLIFIRINV